jgi:hypothetical protein
MAPVAVAWVCGAKNTDGVNADTGGEVGESGVTTDGGTGSFYGGQGALESVFGQSGGAGANLLTDLH